MRSEFRSFSALFRLRLFQGHFSAASRMGQLVLSRSKLVRAPANGQHVAGPMGTSAKTEFPVYSDCSGVRPLVESPVQVVVRHFFRRSPGPLLELIYYCTSM